MVAIYFRYTCGTAQTEKGAVGRTWYVNYLIKKLEAESEANRHAFSKVCSGGLQLLRLLLLLLLWWW